MRQLPFDKDLFDTCEGEVWVDSSKLKKLGYGEADWRENPRHILEKVDKQLRKFGLEIEEIDTKGDWYCWRVVPIKSADESS